MKILPIVKALAKMTPERMKIMREALLRNATSFLTKYCPQKPAISETDIRYKAAKKFISLGPRKSNSFVLLNLAYIPFSLFDSIKAVILFS